MWPLWLCQRWFQLWINPTSLIGPVSVQSTVLLIKRPARDACLHMRGILAEGSAGSTGSASLPTYNVFTSGWNFFKLGTYI